MELKIGYILQYQFIYLSLSILIEIGKNKIFDFYWNIL